MFKSLLVLLIVFSVGLCQPFNDEYNDEPSQRPTLLFSKISKRSTFSGPTSDNSGDSIDSNDKKIASNNEGNLFNSIIDALKETVLGFQVKFYKIVSGVKKNIAKVYFRINPINVVKEDVKKDSDESDDHKETRNELNKSENKMIILPRKIDEETEESPLDKALRLFGGFLSFKLSNAPQQEKINGSMENDENEDDKEDDEEDKGYQKENGNMVDEDEDELDEGKDEGERRMKILRDYQMKKLIDQQMEKQLQEQMKKQHEEEMKTQQEELLRKRQEEQIKKQQEEFIRKQREEQIKKQQEELLRKQHEEQLKQQKDELLRKQHEEELQKQQQLLKKKFYEELLKKQYEEEQRKYEEAKELERVINEKPVAGNGLYSYFDEKQPEKISVTDKPTRPYVSLADIDDSGYGEGNDLEGDDDLIHLISNSVGDMWKKMLGLM